MIDLCVLHLTVLALIRRLEAGTGRDDFCRSAENTSEGVAGNVNPIVHTALHSIRRLIKLPTTKTA
jgi:hypothetical protein